jgi:hypothetical protein
MSVESTTQALCDLALRFGEGDEESMVCNELCATWEKGSIGGSPISVILLYTNTFLGVLLIKERS